MPYTRKRVRHQQVCSRNSWLGGTEKLSLTLPHQRIEPRVFGFDFRLSNHWANVSRGGHLVRDNEECKYQELTTIGCSLRCHTSTGVRFSLLYNIILLGELSSSCLQPNARHFRDELLWSTVGLILYLSDLKYLSHRLCKFRYLSESDLFVFVEPHYIYNCIRFR